VESIKMKNCSSHRGFTLIELLVVVSIITLLISILLPAVGAARTRARVSADVQNMKQHGIGMANYAAANGDTLPNAPIAPPDDKPKPTAGVPGRTARMFGTTEFPVNGFAFQSNGVPTWSPPLDFGGDAMINNGYSWSHMAMCFNGYFVVMSQYMTDQEGIDALQDVFYSPADTSGKDIRDTQSRTYLQGNKGAWPGLSSPVMDQKFRTPSYRYVPAGVVSPAVMDVTLRGDPSGSDLDLTSNSRDISGENYRENGFYSYVKRNPSASVDFPSNKVMFFLEEALHNPNRLSWFEPGAICPVAMADGSARETVPDRDAIDGRNKAAVAERAGSWETVVYKYASDDPNLPDTTVSYYFPYIVTRGGVKGRDL
jgi:prepilin-type N-terminal cleavage/methylation domain-containing protein